MAEAVQVTIPIDQLRDLAQKLIRAYDQLNNARPLELVGGSQDLEFAPVDGLSEMGQMQALTADVRTAIDKFNLNRLALLSQLASQAGALRTMADNFDELEEETRVALSGLESTTDLIASTYTVPTGGPTSGTEVTGSGPYRHHSGGGRGGSF